MRRHVWVIRDFEISQVTHQPHWLKEDIVDAMKAGITRDSKFRTFPKARDLIAQKQDSSANHEE